MNRREFFSSFLKRTVESPIKHTAAGENSSDEAYYSNRREVFLGVQIVLGAPNIVQDESSADNNEGCWATEIRLLAEQARDTTSPDEKRSLYSCCCQLLRNNQKHWLFGYWDYAVGADYAAFEVEQWRSDMMRSSGTAISDASVGGSTQGEHSASAAVPAERKESVVVVSLCVRLRAAYSPSASMMAHRLEAVSEEDYATRTTLRVVLDCLDTLDWYYCLDDVLFVVPSTESGTLTQSELRTEGWEYLQPVI
jgi:hypothetical protein